MDTGSRVTQTGLRLLLLMSPPLAITSVCYHACCVTLIWCYWISLCSNIIIFFLIHLLICVCRCMEVRGQLERISFFLLLYCGSWGLNLGRQAWWQVPLPTDPYCWPHGRTWSSREGMPPCGWSVVCLAAPLVDIQVELLQLFNTVGNLKRMLSGWGGLSGYGGLTLAG